MKRILFAAAASLALAAPLAAPAFADQYRGQPSYDHRDNDRRDYDRNDRDSNWRDNDRDRGPDVRVVHNYKSKWRDNRSNARFDARLHNGYYVKNVWHFGPPPVSAYRTRGFQLGYKPWARGDRLGYYNTRYVEVDYRNRHLKAPPRGYHYVRDDNSGEFLLAALATGIIASIIAGN